MNRREFTMCGLGAGICEAISRNLYAQAFGAATSAPPAVQGVDRFSLVDPELLAAVKGQPLVIWSDEIVANAQEQIAPISAVLPSVPGVNISRRSIPGPTGAPDVSMEISQ